MKWLSSLFDKISVRFIITYLLLLFTTLILCLSIVNQPIDRIKSDIMDNNVATIQQKSNLIDEKLKNVEEVASQIANDPFINNLESKNESGKFFIDLQNASTHLLNYRSKMDDDFVYDYFVYYTNKKYVVTPDTCYNTDFFQSYIAQPQNSKDAASFFNFISTRHTDSASQEVVMHYQSINFDVICFVVPISNIGSSDIENLCLLVPTKYFKQIFAQELENDGCLQILNDSNAPLLTLSNHSSQTQLLAQLSQLNKQPNSSFNENICGKNITLTYSVSAGNGWKYLWLQPQAIAMNTLYSMQHNIMLLFIAALVGGLIITCAFAYYNSKPIYHIAAKLGHNKNQKYLPQVTFRNISDSLDALINNNRSFEEKLDRQKPLLQSVLAGQLLNGTYDSFDVIRANCSYFDFSLDSKFFLVCSVNFLGADRLVPSGPGNIEKINSVKIFFRELANQASSHMLYHDTNISNITLIPCFSSSEQISPFIQSISAIGKTLTEQYEVLIVIGISNPCSHPSQLPKSREEAREALNYVHLDQIQGRVVYYSNIPVQHEDYYYPIDLERKLINTVCLGHRKAFQDISETIISENFKKRVLSNGSIKYLYNNILSTCFHLRHKIPGNSELSEYLKKNSDSNFVNQHNIQQLLDMLEVLCDSVGNHKSDRNKLFIQKILDYLQKDYGNPDLSLTSVAARFNISAGYLSTFFKEQTGKNFTDEVESIRIDAAYQLLKKTDWNINQICLKVGYSNVKSFRRAFEHIKGISPSTARQEILNYT